MDEKKILSYLKELFSKIKATRSFLREKILEESQKLPENEKSMVESHLGSFGTDEDSEKEIKELFDIEFTDFTEALYKKLCGGDARVHDALWCIGDEALRSINKKLSENDMNEANAALRHYVFVFEDITRLTDREVQKVLRQIDTWELAQALSIASDEIQQKIFQNMSLRAAAMLKKDIEVFHHCRTPDKIDAQRRIVSVIGRLADACEIRIPQVEEW